MRPVVSDTPYKHIHIMDDGLAIIGGTRIKVEYIVAGADFWGQNPKEIQEESYPHLTLGQIHSALAYYYDNKELADRQIQEGIEYDEKMRAILDPDNRIEKITAKHEAEKAAEKAESVAPA